MNAAEVDKLSHRYGERLALDDVSFSMQPGEIFGLLGPNGSGKTTLFRVLSTLIPPQSGNARLFGLDVATQTLEARRKIGVVFQAPSLDKKLTAAENLRHQGHLYGLRGADLEQRIKEGLNRVGMADRSNDLTEKLSGGQRRRVELAKGLLHRPELILLDEPSTGLDPGARIDLMAYLKDLSRQGVACLLTTHLMEEAEDCGRVAIMNLGKLAALDTPAKLKAHIIGEVVLLEPKISSEANALCAEIQAKFGGEPKVVDGKIRIEREDGAKFIAQLTETFPGRLASFSAGQPRLDDVFLRVTGHKFWEQGN